MAIIGSYLISFNGKLEFEIGDILTFICAFMFAFQIVLIDIVNPHIDSEKGVNDYTSKLYYMTVDGLNKLAQELAKKRKTSVQKHYEKLADYLDRLKKYAKHIKTCGDSRNSYIDFVSVFRKWRDCSCNNNCSSGTFLNIVFLNKFLYFCHCI